MAQNYAYKYAEIADLTTGLCLGASDGTDYILDPAYVPVTDIDSVNLIMKYYWPLPETVTSFDDFNGHWYHDAAHTQPYPEGDSVLL